MVGPKVCLLIFVSGKVVLTGAKVRFCRCTLSVADVEQTREDIYLAFSQIYPVSRHDHVQGAIDAFC